MKNMVSAPRLFLERLFTRMGMGMRAKLIALFVVIKVVPLVLLALVAWNQSWKLGEELRQRTEEITGKANHALSEAGELAVSDAVKALDSRATEDIERMSTDAARRVADFLYARDDDIRFASSLDPSTATYRKFLENLRGKLIKQGKWELAPDGKSWQREKAPAPLPPVTSSIEENDYSFNYRAPETFEYENRPLYLEMTFVDLAGREKVKIVNSPRMAPELKDVSQRRNTYVQAETYFHDLQKLKPGEIYVSDVIGAYVGSRVIGAYTPENAAKAGVPYSPEQSAYAGKENPLGERFKGIVRWATPVVEKGAIVGYVTLALDHDHIMEFTAHLMPTKARYTEIPDASEGNYAFIWDHKGRNIVHPRHFSITGYDPATGDPQVPWLEDRIYDEWQQSGKSYVDFIEDVPTFVNQSNKKKPAKALTQKGLVGLDCRYLNFAPQCTGWFDLTREGGSGSFLILWSGLWKLNTAAAIPYYTGQYAASPRGFGFIAIGAGVSDFHRPATDTKRVIDALIYSTDKELKEIASETYQAIGDNLVETASRLGLSTGFMAIVVILIAIWMASIFTRSITSLINGISRFRSGERHFRFNAPIKDELGALADSFDDMADSLVASVKGPLVITDLDTNILYMNDAALEKIGKKFADVLHRPYAENSIFPADSTFSPIAALLSGRETEVLFHEPTGKFFKGTASFFANKKGESIGYIITTNDVSDIVFEQKKTEEQRALLDTIFSASPDLIWYKDAQGRYVTVNPRFAAAIGKSNEEIRGHFAHELFSPPVAARSEESERLVIESGGPVYSEESLTFADGHSETIDAVRTPLYNNAGERVGLLGVARDVSRRVMVESELRETQLELKNAVAAANKANDSKSEFLARMSHEIRTPMNAIIGMSNITQRKLNDPEAPTGEILQHVRQIEISSQHLLGLLNDILDISKIEAGKIELCEETFDLPKLTASVASIIRPRCLEKNITFDVSAESLEKSIFISDPLRLRQVLINLLGNAVKFTPECGIISFRITQDKRENGKTLATFSVSDNGIGIPPQALETLFTPFEQGGGQITRQYGGTGLGLSISKSIVNLLGGDITVTSTEGEGSVFSFSLWLIEDDNTIDEVLEINDLSLLEGRRVLLVDDVDINRIIVTEQLSSSGLFIEEAEDGLAALDMFKSSPEGHYNAILMDVQMPRMDGYTASAAIRALPRADALSIPIIAMTANAFKEDVEKALASGMNAHLAKPLEHEKLMELLIRYAGKV